MPVAQKPPSLHVLFFMVVLPQRMPWIAHVLVHLSAAAHMSMKHYNFTLRMLLENFQELAFGKKKHEFLKEKIKGGKTTKVEATLL
eukprot:1154190-Pelagomonas_calceolata.AAC.2